MCYSALQTQRIHGVGVSQVAPNVEELPDLGRQTNICLLGTSVISTILGNHGETFILSPSFCYRYWPVFPVMPMQVIYPSMFPSISITHPSLVPYGALQCIELSLNNCCSLQL